MSEVTNQRRSNKKEKAGEVKKFFDQWNLYQKIIKFNYMAHKEILKTLRQSLSSNLPESFSVLDLGCGDAYFTARALKGTDVGSYVGVDISRVALNYARENMQPVPCEKYFIEGDLMEEVCNFKTQFDVIIAGYSIHHLTIEQKYNFIGRCRIALKPAGKVLLYDLVRKDDETRDAFVKRIWKTCKHDWIEMTPTELTMLHDHIYNSDYPESFEILLFLAKKNGFKQLQSLFRDNQCLYEFCSFLT